VTASFAFDRFILDTRERRLSAGDEQIELNARYFDALALLVREQGRLISKDEFLTKVWNGIPVTDEALTQCIKTLRRQLGDDASRPRFIETIAKHGYRFIATVQTVEEAAQATAPVDAHREHRWRRFVTIAVAGTLGGAAAGLAGGLAYGFAGASDALGGAISLVLILLCLCLLVATIGAAGVSLGIATSVFAPRRSLLWMTVGGAAGGLFVGAFGKLIGLDAFGLLIGQSPGNITGGPEGLALGAAVGFGAWAADRARTFGRAVLAAGASGAAAGMVIALLGGRLMLGSLELLERHLPRSRLRLETISGMLGEPEFGRLTQVITALIEGALFAACIVAAIQIALRRNRP